MEPTSRTSSVSNLLTNKCTFTSIRPTIRRACSRMNQAPAATIGSMTGQMFCRCRTQASLGCLTSLCCYKTSGRDRFLDFRWQTRRGNFNSSPPSTPIGAWYAANDELYFALDTPNLGAELTRIQADAPLEMHWVESPSEAQDATPPPFFRFRAPREVNDPQRFTANHGRVIQEASSRWLWVGDNPLGRRRHAPRDHTLG